MTDKKELNFFDKHFYIHGDFDESISTNIIPKLIDEIEAKRNQKDATIKFFIASNGGSSFMLENILAHVERAKSLGIIVETYVFSHAYSAGSVLACAGSFGHRYIGESAEHLLHLPRTGTGCVSTDLQLDRNVERAKRHFNRSRARYKKYAKVKNLTKMLKDDDYFLYGQEIIDNGLADKFY